MRSLPVSDMSAQSNRVRSLYLRLSTLAVFRSVLKVPLFSRFMDFAAENGTDVRKMKRYAAFAEEIYVGGGDLTDSVRRAVFENENVYVTSLTRGHVCHESVQASAARELAILGDFAALAAADFAADMGAEIEIAGFSSRKIDLAAEYAARVKEIDKYGYGIFAAYGMFRLGDGEHPVLEPIRTPDDISLDSFIGYEQERGKVMANTEAFLAGRSAANVLLYGDAGTGKSSTVKAVANHFFDQGLRLIELRKDQLSLLPYVMGQIGSNPLKFIIFIDDLSFHRSDDCFSMLKAALEGSASAKASNAVIYATSNRRHIVRETFSEREGQEVHRNDGMQEALSLSERFGLTILFARPNQQLYLQIVRELAAKHGVDMPQKELETRAEAFALGRGTRSARCAEQFVESLL